MDALQKRLDQHDAILLGNGDKDGVLSQLRQLVQESKARKAIQTTILVGVIGLLSERILRMLGILMDRM